MTWQIQSEEAVVGPPVHDLLENTKPRPAEAGARFGSGTATPYSA
jgi:hypothetical protein